MSPEAAQAAIEAAAHEIMLRLFVANLMAGLLIFLVVRLWRFRLPASPLSVLSVRLQARYWVWRCGPRRSGRTVSSGWRLDAIKELRRSANVTLKEALAQINAVAPRDPAE